MARVLAWWRPTRHQPEASPSSRVRASRTVAHRAWRGEPRSPPWSSGSSGHLAVDPHRHVAVDHEADAAEHLLLGVAVLGGDQLADSVGEILVVSHRDNHGAWGPRRRSGFACSPSPPGFGITPRSVNRACVSAPTATNSELTI